MRRPVLLLTISVAVVLAFVLLPLRSPSTVTGLHAMPCPDLNGDGVVTVLDEDIFFSYLGKSVPPAPLAVDLNGDNIITVFGDLFPISSELGNSHPRCAFRLTVFASGRVPGTRGGGGLGS